MLVVTATLALVFLPLARYQHSARLLAIVTLSASLLLAVRLHSLRAFFAITSMAAQLLFVRFIQPAPSVRSLTIALIACNFALVLVVDDVFFDWEAVSWWAGFLAVQWTTFTIVSRWAPELLSQLAARQWVLPVGSVGLVQATIVLSALLLFCKFLYSPDAVGAGMVWALAPLLIGVKNEAGADAYLALSGLAVGLSIVERSHWIAYHDELTGLPGRRAFNEALAALSQQYSIAMVDVDHFKRFNDTFGHETGDEVLRKVSRHLAKIGGGGMAYRYGGEEFAVVFRHCDMEESTYYAEALRLSVEKDSFVVRGPSRSVRERPERRSAGRRGKHPSSVKTGVTVSIGIAEPTTQRTEPREVVEAADKALYRAKHLGRNRVEYFLTHPGRKALAEAAARKVSAPISQ